MIVDISVNEFGTKIIVKDSELGEQIGGLEIIKVQANLSGICAYFRRYENKED